MATCDRCGRHFQNKFAFGPHRRSCHVITKPVVPVVSMTVVIGSPIETPEQSGTPGQRDTLRDLAQRPSEETWAITQVLHDNRPAINSEYARDYSHMQENWKRYVENAHSSCSSHFWRLQEALLNQTVACKDKVMSAVKNLVSEKCRQPAWPRSFRTLRRLIQRRAGRFWDNVLHTHTIDLSAFDLPGVTKVDFEFLDPVYVWLERANALYDENIQMQWQACRMLHPDSHEEVFGAGVQYGLIFREAMKKVPAGARLALFNLSWDGGSTGFGSRSAVPICVQVMNTNSASTVGIGLVGYLPYVEVSEAYKEHTNCVKARNYLLQTCIGHVLKCINNSSRLGFLGNLGPTKMHFFPCLAMLTLDTPERVKYFGLRSMRACALCRLRKGRSVVREATRHDPEQIKRLYDVACAPTNTRYLNGFF